MDVDVKDLLKNTQLLSRLDEAGLERLEGLAEQVSYSDGHEVVREGDPGESFFVIVAGLLDVTATSLSGEKTVATLDRGAVVGELSALLGEPRGATVRTVGETVLLRFQAASALEVLRDYPSVLASLEDLGLERSAVTTDRVLGVED
ncbi:MAG: cyclic nucleotide-binding domain-containing protein [Deltaproteobacteria bacterium]|nr:cyclic nucleotide-binding domain-containing protein [Deltaproteobacteria bacterium]